MSMGSSTRCLASSAQYEISHEHETASLTRKGALPVVVGDFYGDPSVAIIDVDERWCAIAGCGMIVYFLEEPFDGYEYDKASAQYFEWGRQAGAICWVKSLRQCGPWEIEILLEDGRSQSIAFQRTDQGCGLSSVETPQRIKGKGSHGDISPKSIEGIIDLNLFEETPVFGILQELVQRFPDESDDVLRRRLQERIGMKARAGTIAFFRRMQTGDITDISVEEGLAHLSRSDVWIENRDDHLIAYEKDPDQP
jgi:hypothetical protein